MKISIGGRVDFILYNELEELSKEVTVLKFRTVQTEGSRLVNRQTAAEIIYDRADSEKDFMGLTSFKGADVTTAEHLFSFYERTEGKLHFSIKANRLLTHEIDSNW